MEIQSIVKIAGFPRKTILSASTATNALQAYTRVGAAKADRPWFLSVDECRCGKSVRGDERGEFLESSDWWCGASVTSGQADSLETSECDETARTSTDSTGLTNDTS